MQATVIPYLSVSRDVFVDLSSDEPVLMVKYIERVVDGDGNFF